jgi:hypothetical protein
MESTMLLSFARILNAKLWDYPVNCMSQKNTITENRVYVFNMLIF